MEVIPAVDIRNGRCVRLTQGRFDKETIYSDDPVKMALHWASLGAERLHVVDLDGAKEGKPQNHSVVEMIAKVVDIPVQVGGGIRNMDAAMQMLNAGVARVIVGTSAALNRNFAEQVFEKLGERVVLGLDARDGRVAVHGWQKVLEIDAIEFALEMKALGAKRIIHTDIGCDGMLTGVNVNAMKRMAQAVGIPVIASGGVKELEDIRHLKKLESLGIEGVIIGQALYTGALDLQKAIAVAR